jgi:hypothetical protein
MELNRNSFSAKLYRWFYATKEMPQNLCPYFWKLVATFILALPVFILTIPFEIIYYKDETKYYEPIGHRLFVSFVIMGLGFVLFLLGVSVAYLFGYSPTPNTFMFNCVISGLTIWVVGTTVGLVITVKYFINKAREAKKLYDEDGFRYYGIDENGRKIYTLIPKEEKPNIIVEFVKAKYNKYCPKINWE